MSKKLPTSWIKWGEILLVERKDGIMTQSTSPMISYFSPRLAAHQVDVLRSVESHLTLAGSKEAGAEIRGSSLIELKSQLDSRFPQWKSSGVLDLYFRYQIMEEV